MSPSALETWLPFRRVNPAARVRLVCLPFAGGSAGTFRGWADDLPLTVDVCAVQPPGRDTRFRESPFTAVKPYAAELVDVLAPLFDRPVAVYGHSFGAVVEFEVARELRRRGLPAPARLIVSGRVAPHLPSRLKPIHALPDAAFRAELKLLNGTPAAVLDNDELMMFFLPVLRADFTAHETYEYAEEPPLDCPILAVAGNADRLCQAAELETWRRHTRAAFEARTLPGDHFFLQTHRLLLLQLIARFLEPVA
jgi:medium-chain acyl-[acyl-carrier-protein] hydrolase